MIFSQSMTIEVLYVPHSEQSNVSNNRVPNQQLGPRTTFAAEHVAITRRFLMNLALSGTAVAAFGRRLRGDELPTPQLLDDAIAKIEPYFTKQNDFRDVSRGKPIPHKLPDDQKTANGLTGDTWSLQFRSDPDNPADIRKPLGGDDGAEFKFADLMQLAEQHAVKFPKVMTCLNIGCPLGMGIWEGVPLRELFWRLDPRKDIRRLFYYGFHNDKPEQMFRSSLPIDRILEDPGDLPPVILCYKLNGELLTSQRGGPVRIVVPEAYGFKSIKWLSHIFASNLSHANDTYAEQNNDVASNLKSFAATLAIPPLLFENKPIPVTGYAQSGVAGLSKVQVWVESEETPYAGDDPYFRDAPWQDATILAPPKTWGGEFSSSGIPDDVIGFDQNKQPQQWPMMLAKSHWATVLPALPAGDYTLRCRTIDKKGQPQPLPRPFRKSGHAAIESVPLTIEPQN